MPGMFSVKKKFTWCRLFPTAALICKFVSSYFKSNLNNWSSFSFLLTTRERWDWIHSMRVKPSAQPIVLSTPTVHSDGVVIYFLLKQLLVMYHILINPATRIIMSILGNTTFSVQHPYHMLYGDIICCSCYLVLSTLSISLTLSTPAGRG